MSHLEAVGATSQTGERYYRQGQGWRKRQQTKTRQTNAMSPRVVFLTQEKGYSGNGGQVTFEDPVSQRGMPPGQARASKQYSFKDEHVVSLFKLL